MNRVVDFPPGLSEEVRIQVCKMLEEKDKEIKGLYKDIITLENKVERFNGGLTYSESENLKTRMAVNTGIKEQIFAGLNKFHLRAVECDDPKSPYAHPIKIERIGISERFITFIKSLIRFKIVRN